MCLYRNNANHRSTQSLGSYDDIVLMNKRENSDVDSPEASQPNSPKYTKKPLIQKPTNFLMKKRSDGMDYIFPVVFLHNSNFKFKNHSEKKRFSSMMELFLKLKYLIDKDPDRKFSYIKEFLAKNGVFEPQYYSYDSLSSFGNFLESKFELKPTQSIYDIIHLACHYKEIYLEKKESKQENHKRSMSGVDYATKLNIQQGNKTKSTEKDHYSFTMRDFLANKAGIENKKKINFDDPKNVISELEKEFKKVRIIPKSESFITQVGDFREIKNGKKKSYEEATLKNINLNTNPLEHASKKKKKLIEYIMVNIFI